MAEEKKDVKMHETAKGLLGKNVDKVGSFQESTGGGTPLAKGEKLKDHPEAKRVMQPRDDDGKFTYNSVNGKELKYGPSRGETVPPILRGVELRFCAKGTKLKLETEEGKQQIRLMTIDLSESEIINNFRYYLSEEKGFAGLGEGSSVRKKGRISKAEKEAEPGIVGHVEPKTLSESTQKEMAEALKYYKPNPFLERIFTKGKSASEPAETKTPATEPAKEAEDKVSTGSPIDADEDKKGKVLESMGLEPEKAEPEDVEFNAEATKDAPKFYAENKKVIDSMVKEFNDKYPDKKISAGNIIQLIRNGKLKSLSQWKKALGK